jgi:hypothetical protein
MVMLRHVEGAIFSPKVSKAFLARFDLNQWGVLNQLFTIDPARIAGCAASVVRKVMGVVRRLVQ